MLFVGVWQYSYVVFSNVTWPRLFKHWILYPVDKYYGNKICHPLDSDLSGGQHYPTFEQPDPDVSMNVIKTNKQTNKQTLKLV